LGGGLASVEEHLVENIGHADGMGHWHQPAELLLFTAGTDITPVANLQGQLIPGDFDQAIRAGAARHPVCERQQNSQAKQPTCSRPMVAKARLKRDFLTREMPRCFSPPSQMQPHPHV